ncbi:MAG: glycosyltransferase, partial [Bacteroidota bacterium]|nr:glycosyltransferase [Bacteroidota bacterium]
MWDNVSQYPAIAIAILNWNGKFFLETLLPALQHLTYSNYSIYIIDNNSSDDSVAFANARFPLVKTIVLDDNYGFATGYNKGLWQIKEPYYLLMNSDVEVTPGFIEPLMAQMQSDEKIAVCQPKILSLQNKQLFEHAGAAGGMMDALGYPFCRGRIFDFVEKDEGQYN